MVVQQIGNKASASPAKAQQQGAAERGRELRSRVLWVLGSTANCNLDDTLCTQIHRSCISHEPVTRWHTRAADTSPREATSPQEDLFDSCQCFQMAFQSTSQANSRPAHAAPGPHPGHARAAAPPASSHQRSRSRRLNSQGPPAPLRCTKSSLGLRLLPAGPKAPVLLVARSSPRKRTMRWRTPGGTRGCSAPAASQLQLTSTD